MTSRAWMGTAIGLLVLVLTTTWYVPSRQDTPPSRGGAITVVDMAGRAALPAVAMKPPRIVPSSGVDAKLTDGIAEERASSIVTSFVAQSSAPLAVERSSCERLHCRMIVHQTAEYVQRGKKFYEDDKFVALTRSAGVKLTSVSSYSDSGESYYVIDMAF